MYFRLLLPVLFLIAPFASDAVSKVIGRDTAPVDDVRIAITPDAGKIAAFWKNTNGRLSFNNSANGGFSWGSGNTVPWSTGPFHHHLGQMAFAGNGRLQGVFVRRDDQSPPLFTYSDDLGENWSAPVPVGGGTLPRWLGAAFAADGDACLVFFNDYNWHGFEAVSSDGGANWRVTDYADLKSGGDPEKGFVAGMAGNAPDIRMLKVRDGEIHILYRRGGDWAVLPTGIREARVSRTNGLAEVAGNFYFAFCRDGELFVSERLPQGDAAGADGMIAGEVSFYRFMDDGEVLMAVLVGDGDRLALAYLIKTDAEYRLRFAASGDGVNWSEVETLWSSTEEPSALDMAVADGKVFCAVAAGRSVYWISDADPQWQPGENLFSNGGMDDFDGETPAGWTGEAWNPDPVVETWGPVEPGSDGGGRAFQSHAGNPIAQATFRTPEIAVEALNFYVLKFHYASTLSAPLEMTVEFRNAGGETLSSRSVLLPETQDQWCEYFREFAAPAGAEKLALTFQKKWSDGAFRLDDFSLRCGRLRDFGDEFMLQVPDGIEHVFPIFSWMGPAYWGHFGENAPLFDTDNVYAEYARCNFTKGYEARFGVQRQAHVPASDEELAALNDDETIWNFHGFDEPGSNMFPELAEINRRVKTFAPDRYFWVNLLPTYGFKDFEEYRRHVEEYIEVVKPVFLTYDFYGLPGEYPRYYPAIWANLEIVRELCLANDIGYGVIHLVVSHGPQRSPGDAELRWQAYTSLAYGYQAIGWFTYLTEIEYAGWNWQDAVLDRAGNRGRHYSMLQRLNREILCLGDTLLQLESTGVFHSDPLPELTRPLARAELVEVVGDGEWVLGEFRRREEPGSRCFMLANRSFTGDSVAKFRLKQPGAKLFEVSNRDGAEYEVAAVGGIYEVPVNAGDGKLFAIR